MLDSTEGILLIISTVLIISIFAGKAGYKFGLPALLLFLGIGMLFGTDGLGIQFSDPNIAQFVGMLSLSIILFSGGMDTKISEIKPIIAPGVILATLGVFFTTLITGVFIYYMFIFFTKTEFLTFPQALLLSAVMSSTDSASVFSILRSKGIHLKQNLRPMLELESGSNDPMAYMLTILLINYINMDGAMNVTDAFVSLGVQFSVGVLIGYLLGRLTVYIINRININNSSLYPIFLLANAFFIFAITTLLKGNGYLAVYIAGLVVGNMRIIHKKSITTFFDGFTWLCQIVMFITLGLLVNPHELLPIIIMGLCIGVFVILISRPLSVFLCLAPFKRFTLKGKLYISWVGLRGAVPIIFATYPMIESMEHANIFFNIVFFITILSLVIQGTSVTVFAKWLHLTKEPEKKNEFGIELADEIKSAISEIDITPQILMFGNNLMQLPLPDNTLVVMVKRDNSFLIPKGDTELKLKDRLLVIADNAESLQDVYDKLGITNLYYKK